MYLTLAIASFVVFLGHILLGSVWGLSPAGDIGELVILLCASLFFVVAILQAESEANSGDPKS